MGLGTEVAGIGKMVLGVLGRNRGSPMMDFRWVTASEVAGSRPDGGRRTVLGWSGDRTWSGVVAGERPVGGGRGGDREFWVPEFFFF
jgi:hypothetical protein